MELIFHIGAGKTGSTSIQKTLKRNYNKLKKDGIWYLGLMLENAIEIKYNWQRSSSVVVDFHAMDADEASKQILDVMIPIIDYSEKHNIHTLIWSNESFMKNKHNFIPALQELQKRGVTLKILIYVRDYASWARSSYIQWGIKHKTYTGELQDFSTWIKKHKIRFYQPIEDLTKVFPENIYVRNMSAIDDVVKDFFTFSKISLQDIKIVRENESLSNEEIVLRAIFNAKYNKKVLPEKYNRIIGRELPLMKPMEYLENIMPGLEDLNKVIQDSETDRLEINKILAKQGQPLLEDRIEHKKSLQVDSEKLLLSLVDIVMKQSIQISRLENIISNMEVDKFNSK